MDSFSQKSQQYITSASVDSWPIVFGYLSNIDDIAALRSVCRDLKRACSWSSPICEIHDQDIASVVRWVTLCIPMFSGLIVRSSNSMKTTSLQEFLSSKKGLTLSISKCFRVDESAWKLTKNCRFAALTDLTFSNESLDMSSSRDLEVMILTNSSFTNTTSQLLWKSLSDRIGFLGLGGSKIVTPTSNENPDVTVGTVDVNTTNLTIETTFLSETDMSTLRAVFSNANFVDLVKDPLPRLEEALMRADVNATMREALSMCSDGHNRTPLHLACVAGDLARARWLLEHLHARMDLKDAKGSTPLHRAAEHRRVGGTSLALMGKEDKEIEKLANNKLPRADDRQRHSNEDVHSDADAACVDVNQVYEVISAESSSGGSRGGAGCDSEVDHIACVLVEHLWRQRNGNGSGGRSAIDLLFTRNQNNNTPLYLAALKGNAAALRPLLSLLRRVCKFSRDGPSTPLHANTRTHARTVAHTGMDTNAKDVGMPTTNLTSNLKPERPLKCASCLAGTSSMVGPPSGLESAYTPSLNDGVHNEVRQGVEGSRVSCHVEGNEKEEEEEVARLSKGRPWGRKHLALLESLRARGGAFAGSWVDAFSGDDKGFTPLHAAVIHRSLECAQLLLDAGFSPNFPNAYCQTPLHLAYRYCRADFSTSSTPQWAVGDGEGNSGSGGIVGPKGVGEAMVAMLLRAGADPSLRDDGGKRPVDYAPRPLPHPSHKVSRASMDPKGTEGARLQAQQGPTIPGEAAVKAPSVTLGGGGGRANPTALGKGRGRGRGRGRGNGPSSLASPQILQSSVLPAASGEHRGRRRRGGRGGGGANGDTA